MSRGAGWLALHDDAEDAVDACLITSAMAFEPLENVRVQADGQLLFLRWPGGCCPFEKALIE